jgi:putative transposase
MSHKKPTPAERTIQLSHKIALVPTAEQAIYSGKASGTARFTWNWALAEWSRQFDAGDKPDVNSLKKAFNAVKYQQYPWLAEIHRDAHAEPFNNLGRAWAKFFKALKGGKPAHAPKFKKKGRCRESFYVANDKFGVKGKTIRLPIVGFVAMREGLRFEGKILGATVSRSADRWFVAIQVEMPEHQALRKRTMNGIEGADLGITSAVTLSSGQKIESPRLLQGMLRRLEIRSRRLCRKLEVATVKAGIKPGCRIPKGTRLPVSSNRKKASDALGRLHYRVANTRKDFSHKMTTRLCRENQAVGIENLNVAGMMKNDRLARAISDIGMGEFARQMRYKARLYDTKVIEADRWFPSSKMCDVCGFVHSDLKLSDRIWTCPNCGTVHDRDINAAHNLKRLATATALPVASTPLKGCTDVLIALSGRKVTPVSHDPVCKKNRGRKKSVHFYAHLE